MDIITHTLSAVSVGTLLATYKCCNWKQKVSVIFASAIGGIVPDGDVVSLWSGFDSTLGEFFSLSSTGKEIYSDTLWYSHHGFMHSLCAIAIFTGIFALVIKCLWNDKTSLWIAWAFAAGYFTHLLGDMITPGGPWGGIRLFFPFSVYVGGTGSIWWWNNYDIFLCTLFMATLGVCFNFIGKNMGKKIMLPLFIIMTIAIVGLVSTKTSNFNRGNYADNEKKSNEIQKELLPSPIYNAVKTFDNHIPVLF